MTANSAASAKPAARRMNLPIRWLTVISAMSVSRMARALSLADAEQKPDPSRDREHGERSGLDFGHDLFECVGADMGGAFRDGVGDRLCAVFDPLHDAGERIIDEVGYIVGPARHFALGVAAEAV